MEQGLRNTAAIFLVHFKFASLRFQSSVGWVASGTSAAPLRKKINATYWSYCCLIPFAWWLGRVLGFFEGSPRRALHV